MARFVTLYFADNAEADRAVAALTDGSSYDLGQEPGGKLIGLYGVPTVFCECDPKDPANPLGLTRGAKLGWWICTRCHRSGRGSYQSPRNLINPEWSPSDPGFLFMPRATWVFMHKSTS